MKSLFIKAKLMLALAMILIISIGGMLIALLYQEEALKREKADSHIEELTYSINSIHYGPGRRRCFPNCRGNE